MALYQPPGLKQPTGHPSTATTRDDEIARLLFGAGWNRLSGTPQAALWNPRVNRAPVVKLGNAFYQGPIGGNVMDLQSVLGSLQQGEIGFTPMANPGKSVQERAKDFSADQQQDDLIRQYKMAQLLQALGGGGSIDPLTLLFNGGK